jgi:hypothetical protein
VAPGLGARFAKRAVFKLGPNDTSSIQGFRDDWERDGATIFRWTTPSARVDLPLRATGDGFHIGLRARRHFVDPATVTVIVEDRSAGAFVIQAGADAPYRTIDFALPPLAGQRPFSVAIRSQTENPRPLGIALDWIELRRTGTGRFILPRGSAVRGALVGAFAALPAMAGGLMLGAGHAAVVVASLFAGAAWDPLAVERILREGTATYVFAAGLAWLLLRWPGSRGQKQDDHATWSQQRSLLLVFVLVALSVRLALLLHPRFYYPDVRVHALFARELARNGLGPFLVHFTDNQFRYSLGLQFEGGHWYAFPYPPVFYLLCGPLVRFFGYSPEIAVSIVAAVANSLEVLIVFAIARGLRLGGITALGAAGAVTLLPLFLVRLSLAYFPAITGHAVDALVILALVACTQRLDRLRGVLTLATLTALALLTYTQSVVNLGLFLPLLLGFQLARERGPAARRRHLGLAAAGALGSLLALGVFYARYVPVFLDMRRGIPMAGESIVLERLQRLHAVTPEADVEEHDDPYAQPTTDLVRGVRKAGHRIVIFYGFLAPFVAIGFLMLIKRSEPGAARLVSLWGLTFVLVCVGSGGLPGPNLLRYAKELEFIAPLCAISLALFGAWLWTRSRVATLAYGLLAVGYGVIRLVAIFAERVMTLQS